MPDEHEKTSADDTTEEDRIPSLFATIHFQSAERPDGYTDEEIGEMNRLANQSAQSESPPGTEAQ
jgi:hypothetical protein